MITLLAMLLVVLGLVYLFGSTSPRFYPERVVVPSAWALDLDRELDTMARHEELLAEAALEDSVDAEWVRLHWVATVAFDRALRAGRMAWLDSARRAPREVPQPRWTIGTIIDRAKPVLLLE